MTMKVFLVEDHTMVRQGLYARLERESGIEIVGEASDGRTAIDLIPAYQPDIVIVDVGLPDLSGIEVTRQIQAKHPRVKFVALSEHADKRFVEGLFEAGGSAYLLKTNFINELVEALWEMTATSGDPAQGKKVRSPEGRRVRGGPSYLILQGG